MTDIVVGHDYRGDLVSLQISKWLALGTLRCVKAWSTWKQTACKSVQICLG